MSKSRRRAEHIAAEEVLERLEAECRARGLRLTRQRRAVLAELLTAGGALSAYELLERLRPRDPSSTPASIYRSLHLLMELGVVHRIESTRTFVPCDHPGAPHPMQLLICRQCGQVVEAEDERVTAAADRLGERLGFALDQRVVELTGVCGDCRQDGARH